MLTRTWKNSMPLLQIEQEEPEQTKRDKASWAAGPRRHPDGTVVLLFTGRTTEAPLLLATPVTPSSPRSLHGGWIGMPQFLGSFGGHLTRFCSSYNPMTPVVAKLHVAQEDLSWRLLLESNKPQHIAEGGLPRTVELVQLYLSLVQGD